MEQMAPSGRELVLSMVLRTCGSSVFVPTGTYSAIIEKGRVSRETSGPKLAVNKTLPSGDLSHAAASSVLTSYKMLPDFDFLAERNLALVGMSTVVVRARSKALLAFSTSTISVRSPQGGALSGDGVM